MPAAGSKSIPNLDRLGHLVVNWQERGGPPVRPPTRRGFGSTVIERSIAHDLKGEAELEFALAGVKARFTIPAAYVRMPPATTDEAGAESATTPATSGGALPDDVLLVEDNMIIALDTEETMLKLGVKTVRIASGVADALKAIEERAPDFALLDVNLGAETSFEIAEALTQLSSSRSRPAMASRSRFPAIRRRTKVAQALRDGNVARDPRVVFRLGVQIRHFASHVAFGSTATDRSHL